jgi:excisionase family DNA binding protein
MFWGSHPTPPFLVYRTRPTKAHMIEQHYTIGELAALHKCHKETIRRRCEKGELRGVRVASNWRIPESAVREYLEGGNVLRFKRKAG